MSKNKKDENMSFYEIVSDYEVISEKQENGYKIAELRTHSGHRVICRIPVRTPEENKKIAADICEAMIKFACPDLDLSKVEKMKVEF